jgi:predicted dienelactone hydrolase
LPSRAVVLRFVSLVLVVLTINGCSGRSDRPIPVGRLHLGLDDPTRSHWSGEGQRPIAATVWYPAAAGSEESSWTAGPFRFGSTALNAAIAENADRLPLVLLSHGTGGSSAQLSWLAERLVQAGFLVAGVNHHGNTAVEAESWPAGFVLPGERARDLSVLLDRLVGHERFGPLIDPERIGAAGFSLGGFTALSMAGLTLPFETWAERCEGQEKPACRLPPEATFSIADVRALSDHDSAFQAGIERSRRSAPDERISALYGMAPALLTLLNQQEAARGSVPVRVLLAEADDQVLLDPTRSAVARLFPQASIEIVPAAGHYAFLAPCGFWSGLFVRLCNDPAGVDRVALHRWIAADAVDFFDNALGQ